MLPLVFEVRFFANIWFFLFTRRLDKASTHANNYTLKPELINGWKGDAYWYYFNVYWTGTNGVDESFGTRTFYLVDE